MPTARRGHVLPLAACSRKAVSMAYTQRQLGGRARYSFRSSKTDLRKSQELV